MVKHQKIEAVKGKGSLPAENTSLKDAFDIQYGEVISLVGAGGKTTLMSALAKELAATGEAVITTTTTKIFDWQAPGSCLILETDEDRMITRLIQELKKHRHITLASQRLITEGKLKGVSPELVARLAELRQIAYTIVEADGAARKPLKAPNTTEPVIPQNTSLVIAIVGMDALGSRLIKENVFRAEIASRLTGLPLGSVITANAITTLLIHPEGIIKGSPAYARIIPFINKVDFARDTTEAEALARKILERGRPRIERVIMGQVQTTKPVVEIFQAEN